MRTLAVDVGNSRTKVAVCDSGDGLPTCQQFKATPNGNGLLPLALRELGVSCDRAVIAGSNHSLVARFIADWPTGVPQPINVTSWRQLNIKVQLSTPETTGIDRLLNAVGVTQLWPDETIVVVDAGTATTVDLVTENAFQGGAILPGLELSAQSLRDHTDALLLVDTLELAAADIRIPAQSTQEAIEALSLIHI